MLHITYLIQTIMKIFYRDSIVRCTLLYLKIVQCNFLHSTQQRSLFLNRFSYLGHKTLNTFQYSIHPIDNQLAMDLKMLQRKYVVIDIWHHVLVLEIPRELIFLSTDINSMYSRIQELFWKKLSISWLWCMS